MKILILGHGGHGKGAIAQIINDLTGMSFCSSSVFSFEKCIWPAIGHEYDTKEKCYEDRRNRRDDWFDLIANYCVPKDRLASELVEKFDIYDGMRSIEEFVASYYLFDYILWVDRSMHCPHDPSMEITFADVVNSGGEGTRINNNGTIEQTTNIINYQIIPRILRLDKRATA